jgi:hypothetical protein
MNIHKKLISMGFSVCSPHKITNEWREPYRMIPDDKETKRKLINDKWVYVEVKKIHPKWQKFYKLNFDENLTIWIKTNQSVINDIWIEGFSVEDGVKNIYTYVSNNAIFNKNDILKKLPIKVQRDFILNDIFK